MWKSIGGNFVSYFRSRLPENRLRIQIRSRTRKILLLTSADRSVVVQRFARLFQTLCCALLRSNDLFTPLWQDNSWFTKFYSEKKKSLINFFDHFFFFFQISAPIRWWTRQHVSNSKIGRTMWLIREW